MLELQETLPRYGLPSQSLWRACELTALRRLVMKRPILELGCGDAGFSSLLFNAIDVGIDINRRAVDRTLRKYPTLYGQCYCMDARSMDFPDASYMTVFANCVIEHIPNVARVLAECYRVLRHGGQFVATVPLREMNNHLFFSAPRYARMRQRQLAHVNLLAEHEWIKELQLAGFASVQFISYLSGRTCRAWDLLDFPVSIGYGRYTISAFLLRLGRLMPLGISHWAHQRTAAILSKLLDFSVDRPACAAVLVASK